MTVRENIRAAKILREYSNMPDVSYGRVMLMDDMAARGVYPDGTFGDNDCLLWEEFRFLFRNGRCAAMMVDL